METLVRLLIGTGILAGAATALAIVYMAVSAIHRSHGLVDVAASHGKTTASPVLSVICALCVLFAIFVAFVAENLAPRDGSNAPAFWSLLVIALVGAGVIAPFQFHRWRWNDEGVEWRGVLRSAHISWRDVVTARAKRLSPGEFEGIGRQGQKIEWSIFTLGAACLFEALKLHRPDLSDAVPTEEH